MAVKKAQLLANIQEHLITSEMFIENNPKFRVTEGSRDNHMLTQLSESNSRLMADLLNLINSLKWIEGNLQSFKVVKDSPKLGDEVPPTFRR